jgi:hypothetical protein
VDIGEKSKISNLAKNEHLADVLTKEPPKYTSTMREGIKLYVHQKTNMMYIPAALRASILQWYHTTL